MRSHCIKMHCFSIGVLSLSIGWLLLCLVSSISGNDNLTNSTLDAMTAESFPENAANRDRIDSSLNVTAGTSENLERQKKENRFGDTGDDAKDPRYHEKEDMEIEQESAEKTDVTSESPFIPLTKMVGPRIERVMERYLITPTDESITMNEIGQQLKAAATNAKEFTERIEVPVALISALPAIRSENFDEIVLNSNTTWVIQFYSTDCAGCMISLKNLTETKKNLANGTNYAAINVAEEPEFIKRFKLSELPQTKVFFPKGTIRVELPNPIADNVNTLPSTDTFGTTVFEKIAKKGLRFSTNFTTAMSGHTKLPHVKTPGRDLFHGNDSRIKMKQLDSSTKPTRSDADSKSLNEALHALLIYAVFKRIFKCIFIYFVNSFANYQENPDF